MKYFIYYLTIGIFCIISRGLSAQITTNPLADFLARYHREAHEKVYRLVCDIDNDGNPDVFLSYASNIDKDGECGWVLYLRRDTNFIDAAGLTKDGIPDSSLSPTFCVYRYVIGSIPEINAWGLLTSEISTGTNGGTQYKAIIVQGNAFRMVDIVKSSTVSSPSSPSSNPTQIPSRFPMPLNPTIEELNP